MSTPAVTMKRTPLRYSLSADKLRAFGAQEILAGESACLACCG